jgi:hypothetical protein
MKESEITAIRSATNEFEFGVKPTSIKSISSTRFEVCLNIFVTIRGQYPFPREETIQESYKNKTCWKNEGF